MQSGKPPKRASTRASPLRERKEDHDQQRAASEPNTSKHLSRNGDRNVSQEDTPRHPPSSPSKKAPAAKVKGIKGRTTLTDDLEEAMANNAEFMQLMCEGRTCLQRETRAWCLEYNLDVGHIAAMAERLLQGDLEHLYDDLEESDRAVMDTAVLRIRSMSMRQLMRSLETMSTDPLSVER